VAAAGASFRHTFPPSDLRLDGDRDAAGRLTDLLLALTRASAPAGGALQATGTSR